MAIWSPPEKPDYGFNERLWTTCVPQCLFVHPTISPAFPPKYSQAHSQLAAQAGPTKRTKDAATKKSWSTWNFSVATETVVSSPEWFHCVKSPQASGLLSIWHCLVCSCLCGNNLRAINISGNWTPGSYFVICIKNTKSGPPTTCLPLFCLILVVSFQPYCLIPFTRMWGFLLNIGICTMYPLVAIKPQIGPSQKWCVSAGNQAWIWNTISLKQELCREPTILC